MADGVRDDFADGVNGQFVEILTIETVDAGAPVNVAQDKLNGRFNLFINGAVELFAINEDGASQPLKKGTADACVGMFGKVAREQLKSRGGKEPAVVFMNQMLGYELCLSDGASGGFFPQIETSGFSVLKKAAAEVGDVLF